MKLTKKKYKYYITAAILFILIAAYCLLMRALPKEINVTEGENISFMSGLPITEEVDGQEVEEAIGAITRQTHFTIQCKLFGLIPVRAVQANVVDEVSVLPAGVTAGLYVKTNGILVIDTGVVINERGESVEPAQNIIQKGDYILCLNQIPLESKEQLVETVNEAASRNEAMILKICRNHEVIDVQVTPVRTKDQDYKLGIWIRDELAGIGTVAYITQHQSYAILGHAISDVDTGEQIEIASGNLYETHISNIVSGVSGSPGELQGNISFDESKYLGSIEKNTQCGVFGTLDRLPQGLEQSVSQQMPVMHKQDIQLGKAEIVSNISGSLQSYAIEIIDLNYNGDNNNKSILLQVTDEELLKLTGGIIQGMSGSPIIQNGKMVGAVTHVFVSDPTKGYGIFAETMLEQE